MSLLQPLTSPVSATTAPKVNRGGSLPVECASEKSAFAAVSVPSTLCWSVAVVCRALDHMPVVYGPAATVGAASVGHERTKGESRDQRTRDMRGIAEIAEFADQGAGN